MLALLLLSQLANLTSTLAVPGLLPLLLQGSDVLLPGDKLDRMMKVAQQRRCVESLKKSAPGVQTEHIAFPRKDV